MQEMEHLEMQEMDASAEEDIHSSSALTTAHHQRQDHTPNFDPAKATNNHCEALARALSECYDYFGGKLPRNYFIVLDNTCACNKKPIAPQVVCEVDLHGCICHSDPFVSHQGFLLLKL